MILFIEHGRLGNQMFQYVALRSYAPGEKLILIGFDDLKSMFDNLDAYFILSNKSISFKILKRIRVYINKFFDFFPLFSTIEAHQNNYYINILCKKGIFSKVKYAFTHFFQSETLVNKEVASNIDINSKTKENAEKHLNKIYKKKCQLIFIHIRRGDYLSWPSNNYPAVLPLSWYIKCMDKMYAFYENPFFIVASDDFFYAYDVFKDRKDVHITAADKETDFTLMTLCQGGILSASSFAWWAAYFAKENNPNGLFLAPLYWAGHRKGEWIPPHIKSTFLEYIELDETDATFG